MFNKFYNILVFLLLVLNLFLLVVNLYNFYKIDNDSLALRSNNENKTVFKLLSKDAVCNKENEGFIKYGVGKAFVCIDNKWRETNLDIKYSYNDCFKKNIGERCRDTEAIYAGNYNGYEYMITPSGCISNEIDEISYFVPICGNKKDVTRRSWNDSNFNYYDINNLKNYNIDP